MLDIQLTPKEVHVCSGKRLLFTCTLAQNLNSELVWRINYASLSAQDVRASFITSVDNVGREREVSTSSDVFIFTLTSKSPMVRSSVMVNSSHHLDGALVECSGTLSISAGPLDKNESFIHIISGK